ncbi:MAG: DUF5916 domain-containing protein [Bacteroidota bacterium]
MKSLLTLLISLLFLTATANDTLRTAIATRVASSPKVDGILNEDIWKQGIASDHFIESRPDYNVNPSQLSSVKILYDDRAIYIGAVLYDTSPDSILAQLGRRDEENLNADDFYFKIDPYHNNQDAYQFGVNAGGVQFDSKFSDLTFDAVWNSAVKITAEGWVVEMEIPYSAIRFPKTNIQEWGLQITRTVRRSREFSQWSLVPLTASNSQLFWGLLKGIESIHSPMRLSFTPYFATTLNRQPVKETDNTLNYQNSFSYSAGADIKYGIDDRFTLDMILLPDFGQVQSDKKVKNLGYTEVVFDENRSFFKEGVELFGKDNLFYSRRIGKTPSGYEDIYDNLRPDETVVKNPSQVKLLNAFKISGRTNGGLGLGIFNAVTNNTYAEVKDSTGSSHKILTEPLTDYNIIVFDQQLKNNSSYYLINTHTNRDKGYDDANVTGTGFSFSNKKNSFVVNGSGALSQKFAEATDKNTYTNTVGYKYFFEAAKLGGNAQYGISREEVNDEFNTTDLGYFIIPGYIRYNAYSSIQQYKRWHFIRESFHDINGYITSNYITGDLRQSELNFNSFFNTMSYNAFFVGGGIAPFKTYDYRESREDGRKFRTLRYYYIYAGISSDYRKRLAVDLTLNRAENVAEFTHLPYYEYELSFRIRVNNHLFIKTNFNYTVDFASVGYAYYDKPSGSSIFGLRKLDTYENIIAVNYIFKNDMLLSITGRHYWNTGNYNTYFNLEDDGELTELHFIDNKNNFSSNFFNIDIVYEWRFAPGSYLNLVYKNAIETEGALTETRFNRNFNEVLNSPQNNTFSIKVLYYLDYLKFRRRS